MSILRRRGRFVIPDFMVGNPKFDKILYKIMGRVIVTRAEYLFITKEFEYFALSNCFDEIDDSEVVPEYKFAFDLEGNQITGAARL